MSPNSRKKSTVNLLRSLARQDAGAGSPAVLAEVRARTDLAEAARELLLTGSPGEKITALSVMRGATGEGVKEAFDVARLAMRDADPDVRRLGVEMLGAVDSPGELADALDGIDSSGRVAVLENISRKGIDVASAEIIPFLSDAAPRVRLLALKILSRSPGPKNCPMVAVLLSDAVSYVRRSAMRAVGEMGCSEAVAMLTRISREADQEDDRYEALTALFTLVSDEVEPLLLRALRDPSAKVRNWAAHVSRGRSTGRVISALFDVLESDPSAGARAAAAHSLADSRRDAPQALGHLGRAIRCDTDASVRIASVHAVSEFGSDGLPHLFQAVDDSDARVRRAAVIRLKSLQSPLIPAVLRSLARVEKAEEVLAELVDYLPARPSVLENSTARSLCDPNGDSSAFTTWLADLSRYPASTGITFYATGRCALTESAEGTENESGIEGGGVYRFAVNERGELCIDVPELPQMRTSFSIMADTCVGVYGEVRECYKLTLDHWGPPFQETHGPAFFFAFRA
ncbi:HEAT repeat domain-containing protein [Streptomyces sparsogenes]|uniref:HEAT repeat domain-containing protein n=1 Tax=Streptomyces sparsogenes TaxID=67365 RepID=UPI00384FCBA4